MARLFGLLQKKRGQRTTGSRMAGTIAEAAIFGSVMLLGLFSLGGVLFGVEQPTDLSMMLLLSISLVLMGGGGVILAIVQFGISVERRKVIAAGRPALDVLQDNVPSAHRFPSIPPDADLSDSPGIRLRYRLPQIESAFWPTAAASLFFVGWSIVTLTLAVAVGVGFWHASTNWFFVALLPVCLLVNGWSGRYFFRQLRQLTLLAPTVVEISQYPLLPGSQCDAYISQGGAVEFKSLKVFLVCEEQASYHQGTDLRIESAAIYRQRVAELGEFTAAAGHVLEHEFCLSIPAQAMHSFRGQYNRIQWKLVIEGRSATMPALRHSFPLIVHPRLMDGVPS